MGDRSLKYLALAAALLLCATCASASRAPRAEWAIAIHGGAGSTSRSITPESRAGYEASLRAALELGRRMLSEGRSSLDTVEQVVRMMEDDERFNAGRGAVFNAEGQTELDASIMDGSTLACGAVSRVRTVKNPISLARLVMERTRHVLLSGDGAERFAQLQGVERVSPEYFFTQRRWDALQRALRREAEPEGGGTVGVAARDRDGNLAAGTSTGGLTAKMLGRVGDSPIVGAGTYANNATCAVSGTGKGEEFIRHSIAYSISARMEHGGMTLQEAVEQAVERTLHAGEGGVIAVGADGSIALAYNTESMLRGAADSTGRFEVAIWD